MSRTTDLLDILSNLDKFKSYSSSTPVTSEGSYSPRYNVIRPEVGITVYEIALPGLTKEDVKLSLEDTTLTVYSDYKPKNASEYLINSASVYPFRMRFSCQGLKVVSAKMENGLLSVRLEAQRNERSIAID
jgi:HSP20 family molecular chaperone IbpA